MDSIIWWHEKAVENDDFLGNLINGLSKQYVIYNFTWTLAENPPSMNFQILSSLKFLFFCSVLILFLLYTNEAFKKKRRRRRSSKLIWTLNGLKKKNWQTKITSVRRMTIWWLKLASDFWVLFNTSIATKTMSWFPKKKKIETLSNFCLFEFVGTL